LLNARETVAAVVFSSLAMSVMVAFNICAIVYTSLKIYFVFTKNISRWSE